jgi:hypothetical protein
VSDPPPAHGAFSKRAPVQGANGQPFSGLTLQWFDSSGASGYQVCLGTQAGLCDMTGGWTGLVNGTAWTVNAALQPATTYWWQVRAVNASGQTQADGGQWWYFTTAPTSGAPAAFGKRAPVNAAAGQPTAVTLRWDAASGASGYRVCAGLLPGDCVASGGWVNVGNVTQWTLSGLNYATTYWWQVQALNASGQTMADGGAWWRFTTVNDPGMSLGPFRKQAPVHLATGVPAATAILSWTASAGASSYEVCAGSGPGFCEVTGGWLNVGNFTQWAPAGLSAATSYWWQVRARDDAGGLMQADGGRWWAFNHGRGWAGGVRQADARPGGERAAVQRVAVELGDGERGDGLPGLHRDAGRAVRCDRQLGERRQRHQLAGGGSAAAGDDVLVAGAGGQQHLPR